MEEQAAWRSTGWWALGYGLAGGFIAAELMLALGLGLLGARPAWLWTFLPSVAFYGVPIGFFLLCAGSVAVLCKKAWGRTCALTGTACYLVIDVMGIIRALVKRGAGDWVAEVLLGTAAVATGIVLIGRLRRLR